MGNKILYPKSELKLDMAAMIKNHLLNRWAKFHETWYAYLGLQPIVFSLNDGHRMTLTILRQGQFWKQTPVAVRDLKVGRSRHLMVVSLNDGHKITLSNFTARSVLEIKACCSPRAKSWQKQTLNEDMQLIKVNATF